VFVERANTIPRILIGHQKTERGKKKKISPLSFCLFELIFQHFSTKYFYLLFFTKSIFGFFEVYLNISILVKV